MEYQKSLAPHTGKVFEAISRLECIKPYTLVGPALLRQTFELGASYSGELLLLTKMLGSLQDAGNTVTLAAYINLLDESGEIRNYEIGSFDFASFNFEGVNLSFYAAPRKAIKSMVRIPYLNNLCLADMESIGAMKMETMLRRSKFRDYYDIYSILLEGGDINKMIAEALEHSDHKLRTKSLLFMLTDGRRFIKDKGFEELQPVYDVSSSGIEAYIKSLLMAK